MRNMIDGVFRRQPPAANERYAQELYGKFRVLGANVDRLKQLGLAIPELEQLLERLETIHNKSLVGMITSLAQLHLPGEERVSNIDSIANVLKTCPRCGRELTKTNVIEDHQSDDLASFVLVCECGYVKEIKNHTMKNAGRQSTLHEYPFSMPTRINDQKKGKNNF